MRRDSLGPGEVNEYDGERYGDELKDTAKPGRLRYTVEVQGGEGGAGGEEVVVGEGREASKALDL